MKCIRDENAEAPRLGCPCFHCYVAKNSSPDGIQAGSAPGSVIFVDDPVAHMTEKRMSASVEDMVNHPPHYTSNPANIECIDVVEHLTFNIGNAIKYLWRATLKGSTIQDYQKAIWYINREISRLQRRPNGESTR